MSHFSLADREILEDLFDMRTGFVLNLTNYSLQQLIRESAGIDIYASPGYEEYCSKAWKIRTIWNNESDRTIGIVNKALLEYAEHYHYKQGKLDEYKSKLIKMMLDKSQELIDNAVVIVLPVDNDISLDILLEDINADLKRGHPELAVDRLHTFSIRYLREICAKNDIPTAGANGNKYALHSLIGMLCKKYEKDGIRPFAVSTLKCCISIFENYNNLRNDSSYAHDNPIINKDDALLSISVITDILKYIDSIENA